MSELRCPNDTLAAYFEHRITFGLPDLLRDFIQPDPVCIPEKCTVTSLGVFPNFGYPSSAFSFEKKKKNKTGLAHP
jgi:hypothetical protein